MICQHDLCIDAQYAVERLVYVAARAGWPARFTPAIRELVREWNGLARYLSPNLTMVDRVRYRAIDLWRGILAQTPTHLQPGIPQINIPPMRVADELVDLGASTSMCEHPDCVNMDMAFARMKSAAVAAKWPMDLSPQVVAIDREWQRLRQLASPNLAYVDALQRRAVVVTTQLNARVRAVAPPDPNLPSLAPPPRPQAPPPPDDDEWWKSPWVIGGAAVAGLGVLAAILAAMSRPQSDPRRRYRPRWR